MQPNFQEFCKEMMIPANEKLETNLLNATLAKTLTLYHGSPKDLKVISPTSYNMGTRLSPYPRKSSFWTDNFDYAVVWALDHLAIALGMEYYHNIDNCRFVVRDAFYHKPLKSGDRVYNAELMILAIEQNAFPLFVYEAEIPTKYIGRGQFRINEYTVDRDVKPDKKTKITKDMAYKVISIADNSTFDYNKRVGTGVYEKKENSTLIEKLLFKNPNETMQKRIALYKKMMSRE